ncbi:MULTISPECIES: CynX/NimT family MFS transporter [Bacillus]|uniref:MFS transporter n=1 Tax=Bacillus TaxID=1386 RepID=UPI0001A097F2|nr:MULTISPECIES: MFS transporter [Bacillus]EEL24062.1 Major facilitator superfamily MFS_1 [Bacillus cereus Rock1-3]EEL41648.1 Major facilitator superfamily MFS_1 [Bacillus cereus Rock3-29]KAB0447988.1 MFS transporter [Lysinibacillus sp. VIA-II-2016]KXY20558.1 MFS transporter [Bacillus cereus]MDH8703758.1 CP family cyanate transporter-like MFS transporter [Stenotrophomonas sp. 1198]
MKLKHQERTYLYILALFFTSINLRIGITSISPLLETIRQDLNISNFSVSFLTAIPVFCMGTFALLTGKVIKKYGAEKAIMACLILIGFATCMRAFTSSILTLFTSALFIGIGIALAGPLLSGFIKEKFPTKIGLMIGIYSVGMGTGASLSAGLTLPLQHVLKGSWNMALAFWGVLTIIAIIFWYPVMKRKKNTSIQNKKNNNLPLRNKKAWLFTIFFGLQSGIFYSITTWLAPANQSMGVSSGQAGTLITVFTVIQMICSFLIPTLADIYKNRPLWLLGSICFVLAGLSLMIYPLTTPWIPSILLGIGLGGVFPLALMLPLYETKTSEDASAWTAMMQSGGYIMGGFIPVLAGIARDYFNSYTQIFIIMALLSLVLFILTLVMNKTKIEAKIA